MQVATDPLDDDVLDASPPAPLDEVVLPLEAAPLDVDVELVAPPLLVDVELAGSDDESDPQLAAARANDDRRTAPVARMGRSYQPTVILRSPRASR